MKKIVATRMYDFNYFHRLFFDYYLSQGYNDILVFCKPEHLLQLSKTNNSCLIKFIELPEHQIPFVYKEEKAICNWIFQTSLNYYENNYSEDEAIMLFADDDEFYPDLNPASITSRAIFLEWYLHSDATSEIDAPTFYKLVLLNKCKGQLLTIWNDPYYKESIIKITPENLSFFRECVYSNAFHRITHNRKIIDLSKDNYYAHHLKGIPLSMARERIMQKINNLKIEDDWCSNHYILEFQKYNAHYENFYETLQSKVELDLYIKKKLAGYNFETSFYETKVLPLDWNSNIVNTPSVFFKKK